MARALATRHTCSVTRDGWTRSCIGAGPDWPGLGVHDVVVITSTSFAPHIQPTAWARWGRRQSREWRRGCRGWRRGRRGWGRGRCWRRRRADGNNGRNVKRTVGGSFDAASVAKEDSASAHATSAGDTMDVATAPVRASDSADRVRVVQARGSFRHTAADAGNGGAAAGPGPVTRGGPDHSIGEGGADDLFDGRGVEGLRRLVPDVAAVAGGHSAAVTHFILTRDNGQGDNCHCSEVVLMKVN